MSILKVATLNPFACFIFPISLITPQMGGELLTGFLALVPKPVVLGFPENDFLPSLVTFILSSRYSHMDENQSKTLSLKAAYSFGVKHGLQLEVDEIRNMVIEWDLSYTSSLRRGYIVELFEKNGIFEEFKKSCWPYGNTPGGEAKGSALCGSNSNMNTSWQVATVAIRSRVKG